MKDRIILYDNKKECCGCGVCEAVCPKKAIKMVEDEYGNIYPKIDNEKCIRCGLCKKKCNYKIKEEKNELQESYVAVTQDKENLKNSASGGIFFSIAKRFINSSGIVFGCNMEMQNGNINISHIKIEDESELYKIQGSKYVQSSLKNCFLEVRNEINKGKKVLFSGTPCQISALYSFLAKDNISKLYTIDIICHGVPNQKIFKEYIRYIEKKEKIKVNNYIFRDKKRGWNTCGKIEFYNKNNVKKEKYFIAQLSSYYKLFLDGIIYRENCYCCPFASEKRVSNLTIGDYWGIQEEHPELLIENGGNIDKKLGVSFVNINDFKGKELLEKYGDEISKYSTTYQKAAKHNKQLLTPVTEKEYRKQIMEQFRIKGYKGVEIAYKKYVGIKFPIYLLWNKLFK